MLFYNKNKKAFTLAEALLTLTIMGVIVVMATPIFTRQTALKIRKNKENQILKLCNEAKIQTLTEDERKLCPLWILCRGESSLCYNPSTPGKVIIGNSFIPSPLNEDSSIKLFVTAPSIDNSFDFNTENKRRYAFRGVPDSEGNSETLLREWMDSSNYVFSSGTSELSSSANSKDTIIGFGNSVSGSNNAVIGSGSFTSGGESNVVIGNGSALTNGNYRVVIGNFSKAGNNNLIVGNSLLSSQENNMLIGTADNMGEITNKLHLINVARSVGITGNEIAIGSLLYYDPTNAGTLNIYGDLIVPLISYTPAPTPSDERLKNVKNDYKKGLKEVIQLNPVIFKLKKDKEGRQFVGVIAQDVQKIFPEAITKSKDGYLRIKTNYIFYAMLNALKELNIKNQTLKQKNDKLELEIENLKKQVYIDINQNEIQPTTLSKKSVFDKILNFFKNLKHKLKGGFHNEETK